MNRPELVLQIATFVIDGKEKVPYEEKLRLMVQVLRRVKDADVFSIAEEFNLGEKARDEVSHH